MDESGSDLGCFPNLSCFEQPRLVATDILSPRTAVRHDELVSDRAVDRIYKLTDRLQECLNDAVCVRDRLTRANDANRWPDLEGAVARLLTEHYRRGR